ncbi:polysaccharide pyruvyl transferase family protein [Bacteroides sp. 90-K9/2]|uniref:polysaccharide pyruvyl transferase family protein n=1 Tax=Bacteroides sp. 90-K9/2 TaxID=3142453 RepID=UPI0039B4B6BA
MYYIDRLKTLVPPYFRFKKNYWLARESKIELPKEKRIFIFLAANYGNLGDIAITYAQHQLLHFWKPDYTIVEIPSNCSYSYLKSVVKQVSNEDIVTFVGGGNMGDMYPLYENLRQIIVSLLPINEILQFPLTADFSDSLEGRQTMKAAQRIYGSHKHLKILARESRTSDFLFELLNKSVVVVPDVVLTLDYLKLDNQRKGFSICLRDDKEKFLSWNDVSDIIEVVQTYSEPFERTDTVLSDTMITLDNKEYYLNEFLLNLSSKKLMVTDRLHGMIFAYITGTPAIVFSNSNQKVKNCFEWIKDCGYIFYMDSFDKKSFIVNVDAVMKAKPNKQLFDAKRKEFYNQILNVL